MGTCRAFLRSSDSMTEPHRFCKKKAENVCGFGPVDGGALDRIRTYDFLLRRQTLYPLSYEGAWH